MRRLNLNRFTQAIQLTVLRSNLSLQENLQTEIQSELASEDAFKFTQISQKYTVPRSVFSTASSMRVQQLELDFLCYRILLKGTWRQGPRTALSLRRPGFWQRLWNPYPLLHLKITIREGKAHIHIQRASELAARQYTGRLAWVFELSDEQIRQLSPILV